MHQLSVHIRGPIQLKSFALYTSTLSNLLSRDYVSRGAHYHSPLDKHKHKHSLRARVEADVITATIDGQIVSWSMDNGASVVLSASPLTNSVTADAQSLTPSEPVAATNKPTSSQNTSPVLSQVAYYSAEEGAAKGLVFLNHFGGHGSGVWDPTFGSSLSYANTTGTGGSPGRQVLGNVLLPSGSEVVLMSDEPCSDGDASCGFYRPGSVAFHGFQARQRVFIFEMSMPNDNDTYGNASEIVNMPAIWFLNAQIPRTLQYGNCSCWSSGCGEFDSFEVLHPGLNMAISAVHGNKAGSDSDYFVRPDSGYTKLCVIFSDDAIYAKILPESMKLESTISSQFLTQLIGGSGNGLLSTYDLTDASSG